MISVKNLCKSFGDFTAVDDLSFEVKPGDIVGFLGPNGAGKSTTMKMLTGFLTPTSGHVRVNGRRMSKNATVLQRDIGYLPEGAPAYAEMTTFQFLNFIADIRGLNKREKRERLKEVIEQVELYDVLDKTIDTLSKGFRRRVGLAQAIIHNPQILILDEPTDGLDPNQKQHVRKLIKNLSKDKIVIISTHILEEVSAVCNRVIIIADGAMQFDGTPLQLQQQSRYYQAVTLKLSYAADITGLLEIPGVKDMQVDKETGEVTLFPEQGKYILGPITEHVHHYRLPIDRLHVDEGRLDDVFVHITSHGSHK
ncbi:ABC transporter ATP-binding protein [Salinimonas sediminis]|uniref:ABC transporter ATP-binding protein n=1 Tax=Salinimonas sediminis TaxID=2303538 RepID=A0A346NNY9_9ALTE|nr:ABC transporter ATP-binding protein [Salinimonas sediminis]AXR07246.1 ABC transporter ATP-binding protein [Salinimonas sediminis]